MMSITGMIDIKNDVFISNEPVNLLFTIPVLLYKTSTD